MLFPVEERVHRDLKPSNLFLRDKEIGRVTVLDFGIARRTLDGSLGARTEAGMVVGTPEYMAPEQARGQRELLPCADIFALGCVLFECLTGQPPFLAEHVAGVLAKILFEDPPPLRLLRPDLPESIESLLDQMLAKDMSQRPMDAGELLRRLDALGTQPRGPPAHPAVRSAPAFLAKEQRLLSVIVASDRAAIEFQETLSPEAAQHAKNTAEELRAAFCLNGAASAYLANGTLLITLPAEAYPAAADQAAEAARLSLMLHERWPNAAVALATGPGLLVDRLPSGQVVDRAVDLLRVQSGRSGGEEKSDGVTVEALTVGLLERQFEVRLRPDGSHRLIGERAVMAEPPLLFGKPTPCVGREQELDALDRLFTNCIEESLAQAVLITAPPGLGKSRLRHEFLKRIHARTAAITIRLGRGTAMNAGRAYEILRQAGSWPVNAPPAPQLCGDQSSQAFLDFVQAECRVQPLLLILEDAHYADTPSIKLVDRALRELEELPLCVVALARPEIKDLFPNLWSGRVHEIPLLGLSKKSSERLVLETLGRDTPSPGVARMVQQAAGNPLILEELIRAAAAGKSEPLPETVLAMLSSHIAHLGPSARRILRAGCIVGETFWRQAVIALLAGEPQDFDLDGGILELLRAGIIEHHRESRFAGTAEYGFRNILFCESAYRLLTEEDRQIGHQRVARFLGQMAELEGR